MHHPTTLRITFSNTTDNAETPATKGFKGQQPVSEACSDNATLSLQAENSKNSIIRTAAVECDTLTEVNPLEGLPATPFLVTKKFEPGLIKAGKLNKAQQAEFAKSGISPVYAFLNFGNATKKYASSLGQADLSQISHKGIKRKRGRPKKPTVKVTLTTNLKYVISTLVIKVALLVGGVK